MSNMTNSIRWSDYDVLCDALANVVWHRAAFRKMISVELEGHEDIIRILTFEGCTKKETSKQLVSILQQKPEKNHDLTLKLMKDLSEETVFPDIKKHPDITERKKLLVKAQQSIADLRQAYEPYAKEELQNRQRREAEKQRRIKEDKKKQFDVSLSELRRQFENLTNSKGNPQERGLKFERWLKELLELYDLNPQDPYVASSDQIDGAFEFSTDSYILEAKWLEKPAERKDADIFNAKLQRKNRNTLGLFVSINGFSQGFKNANRERSLFITMDGMDLMGVLNGYMSLTELLSAKKRHIATTGDCYWPINKCIEEQGGE